MGDQDLSRDSTVMKCATEQVSFCISRLILAHSHLHLGRGFVLSQRHSRTPPADAISSEGLLLTLPALS